MLYCSATGFDHINNIRKFKNIYVCSGMQKILAEFETYNLSKFAFAKEYGLICTTLNLILTVKFAVNYSSNDKGNCIVTMYICMYDNV